MLWATEDTAVMPLITLEDVSAMRVHTNVSAPHLTLRMATRSWTGLVELTSPPIFFRIGHEVVGIQKKIPILVFLIAGLAFVDGDQCSNPPNPQVSLGPLPGWKNEGTKFPSSSNHLIGNGRM